MTQPRPSRGLWTHEYRSIAGAAAVIAAASFFSRLLGVFRDRILAGEFGAGDELDVYYAAFRVPDLVYNLLIVGALSAGFIPVFTTVRQRSDGQRGEHWYIANAFLTATVTAAITICAVGAIAAARITPWVTPGFDSAKIGMVVSLSRIMFLSPVLLGVSAVIGGVLQSYRNFFVYSLAPIFYNVGIIIGALFLVPLFGLTGLAWGVVLGAALHLVVQLPAIWHLGWPLHLNWNWRHEAVRTIGRLMLPRTLSLAITHLNLLVLTVLASYLTSGSVAIFHLATNLVMVPVALIGISYAVAVFPTLAERAASGATASFRSTFAETVRHVLFFIIPATVLLLVLRAQVVRAVLGSGAFDWADTVATLRTVQWLTVSLFAQALIPLVVRAFYAYQQTMVPFVIGALSDIATILVSLRLIGQHGVVGLAMAFSFGSIVHVAGLWLALHWRLHDLDEVNIFRSLRQLTLAGLIMAVVTQGVKTASGMLMGTSTLGAVVFQGGLAAFAGLVAYATFLFFVRSPEMSLLRPLSGQRLTAAVQGDGESFDESEGL